MVGNYTTIQFFSELYAKNFPYRFSSIHWKNPEKSQ